VFVASFPGSKKASHRNAGLLGSDAVSACFPTARRKVVSSFSALSGPRVSALRLLYVTLYIAVAGTHIQSSTTARHSTVQSTDFSGSLQSVGYNKYYLHIRLLQSCQLAARTELTGFPA
jgi:hypothetical protein